VSAIGESSRVDVRSRKQFTVEERREAVAAYRAAGSQTERGEVLRRFGTYQQAVWRWGKQIDEGTLGRSQRGRPATGRDRAKVRVRELEAQLAKTRVKISEVEESVGVQGKCLALHAQVQVGDSAGSTTK